MSDVVEHPTHYTSHPSGIECIEITRHHNFPVGNAIKYLWRAGLKQEEGRDQVDKQIEDLRKAKQYIDFEIETLERQRGDKITEMPIKGHTQFVEWKPPAAGEIINVRDIDPTYLVN